MVYYYTVWKCTYPTELIGEKETNKHFSEYAVHLTRL